MKNKEIRAQIESAGLKYWQVAEAMGVHPNTLCIWLRHELNGEQISRVQEALKSLTVERNT